MNQATELPTEADTLDQLCGVLEFHKAQLKMVQGHIHKAEQAIIDAVGVREEGSFSVNCDAYKVTTTQPVSRSVNADLAKDLMLELPKDIADAIFTWKPSLSVRVYKELEKYQATTFAQISRAITSKPGKVSVKVESLS